MSLLPFAHLLGLPSKKKAKKAGQRPARHGKIATFHHLAPRSYGGGRPAMDADDTDAQEPTVPCEFCDGSGRRDGADCEACDGEGEVSAQQLQDHAADFVKEFQGVKEMTQGRRPAPGATRPQPRREAPANARGPAANRAFAAEVAAAARKARGEK